MAAERVPRNAHKVRQQQAQAMTPQQLCGHEFEVHPNGVAQPMVSNELVVSAFAAGLAFVQGNQLVGVARPVAQEVGAQGQIGVFAVAKVAFVIQVACALDDVFDECAGHQAATTCGPQKRVLQGVAVCRHQAAVEADAKGVHLVWFI